MEFEVLFQELTHSTEMIRALLAGVGAEEARVKPSKGTWSILEVTCHLYDEEREDFREHLDFILHLQNAKTFTQNQKQSKYVRFMGDIFEQYPYG